VARAIELAPTLPKDEIMIVNISGRGDKDIFITAMELDRENWIAFLENEVRHGK
jgi:tryptophan synthase beta chain